MVEDHDVHFAFSYLYCAAIAKCECIDSKCSSLSHTHTQCLAIALPTTCCLHSALLKLAIMVPKWSLALCTVRISPVLSFKPATPCFRIFLACPPVCSFPSFSLLSIHVHSIFITFATFSSIFLHFFITFFARCLFLFLSISCFSFFSFLLSMDLGGIDSLPSPNCGGVHSLEYFQNCPPSATQFWILGLLETLCPQTPLTHFVRKKTSHLEKTAMLQK